MKLGNQSQSEIYSKKAINIKEIIAKRNEAKVYYSGKLQKYESQNYEETILDYTKAISIYPDYFEAYNDRGSAYNLIRKSNKAIADFKKALQINPNYGVAQKNKELVEQYKTDKFNAVMNLVTTGLNIATNTMNSINNVNNSKGSGGEQN